MTKNSALSTFLVISIIVILMGIILVIVTQMDRNQAGFISPVSFEQEQANIIEQVYKIRANQTAQAEIENKPTATPTPLSQQAAQALQSQVDEYQPKLMPTPSFDNAYNVWSNNPDPLAVPYYSLRNNPWSPEYRPGR